MASASSFLRNIWYYAMPSDRLKRGQMLAKTLLGEPILFGRDRQGQVFALRNLCPHRAIPLSDGVFNGDRVQCGYHGWQFDTSGSCTLIPSLMDDQTLALDKFRVRSFPITESQGNIWIFMTQKERDQPDVPAPVVPEFEGETYKAAQVMNFPCMLDHAVIGLMDPAHVPFVHRSWWWRADPNLEPEVKVFDPSPFGFTMRRHRLERSTLLYQLLGSDPEVEISFRLPGVRIERVITQQHTLANLTTITPLTETETEVTTLFYTTSPIFTVLKPILGSLVRQFLDQDRQMVIKQKVGLQYRPNLKLIQDADAQAQWYYRLKAEFAHAMAKGRSFENPVEETVLRWKS